MNIEKEISEIFAEKETDLDNKIDRIGDVGDYFRYGDINKQSAIEGLDILIKYLVLQENHDIKETILGIILDAGDRLSIDNELNIELIASNLSVFNEQCLSYVLSLLGYSGKEEYRELIISFSDNPVLQEDVEEALEELNSRVKK